MILEIDICNTMNITKHLCLDMQLFLTSWIPSSKTIDRKDYKELHRALQSIDA